MLCGSALRLRKHWLEVGIASLARQGVERFDLGICQDCRQLALRFQPKWLEPSAAFFDRKILEAQGRLETGRLAALDELPDCFVLIVREFKLGSGLAFDGERCRADQLGLGRPRLLGGCQDCHRESHDDDPKYRRISSHKMEPGRWKLLSEC